MRLKGYDYRNSGYYYITTVTKKRINYFGEVKDYNMYLNEIGELVKSRWIWLSNHFQFISLDEFIIMPNHLHGIIIIKDFNEIWCRDRSRPVTTKKINTLSNIIGAFKTTSSKLIHKIGNAEFSWQRSFYDHVIRNETELNNIREYIVTNILRWELDKENPDLKL